jgi:hypothetical protein
MQCSKNTSLDDLIGEGEHRCRQVDTERLGSFEVDDQLVLGRRQSRKAPACIFNAAQLSAKGGRQRKDMIRESCDSHHWRFC